MRSLSDVVKAYDVRGLVPDQLDDEVARALGAAFATLITRDGSGSGSGNYVSDGSGGGPGESAPVVVAHDMRPHSPRLAHAFARGVCSRGIDVLFVGLASTDELYYASGALHAPGAMFTASHNPAQYNGIKLCRAGARPVGQDSGLADVQRLAEGILAAGEDPAEQIMPSRIGHVVERDVLADYATHLRELVDLSGIRPLVVVVDAANGMAGHTVPAVLDTAAGLAPLPVQIVPLYFELDGSFPNHEANPLDPANLRDLQAAVRSGRADLGLAFDGDADRCFVVDERGEPVSPSAITALVAARLIAGRPPTDSPPTVIHNLITSRAVPEIATELGALPVRTRVGHSFIKAEMAAHDAVFGGEHSAHYYFQDFWYADTGMLAALHVLADLGGQPLGLSQLAARFERYVASGEINSTVTDAAGRTAAIQAAFAGDGVVADTLDGLTLTCDEPGGTVGWWLNVRASNTEPLLRLNVEARDRATMERVRDQALAIIREETTVSTSQPPKPDQSEHPEQSEQLEPPQLEPPQLEPWLREILRCPQCRSELTDSAGPSGGPELVCTNAECGLAYRVDDGIPVMLVDEARSTRA